MRALAVIRISCGYSLLSSPASRSTALPLRCRCVGRKFPPSHRASAPKKKLHRRRDTDGFFKTAFGAEISFPDGSTGSEIRCAGAGLAKVIVRITKGRSSPKSWPISPSGFSLDIAMTEPATAPMSWVKLVRDRDLYRTISTFYGSERAGIRSSLDPQCLPLSQNENRRSSTRTLISRSTTAISSSRLRL